MRETTKCSLCGEDVANYEKALKLDARTWICWGCITDDTVETEDELYDECEYLRERYRRVGW